MCEREGAVFVTSPGSVTPYVWITINFPPADPRKQMVSASASDLRCSQAGWRYFFGPRSAAT
jgi:hypothetical protein